MDILSVVPFGTHDIKIIVFFKSSTRWNSLSDDNVLLKTIEYIRFGADGRMAQYFCSLLE